MPAGILARGRPSIDTQRQRARLQDLIKHATSDEEVLDVWDHVKYMAKESADIQWASLFLAYTLGKPTSMSDTPAGIAFNGDVQIAIANLPLDQLRALASIDASYTTIPNPDAPELPTPGAEGACGD